MTKRMWTADEIRAKLYSDDRWVERALVALFARQTTDEQQVEATRHDNARGFAKPDGHFLASLAKHVRAGRKLTARQLHFARYYRTGTERIGRYAAQLALVANAS